MRMRTALYGYKKESVKEVMSQWERNHLLNKEALLHTIKELQTERRQLEDELAARQAAAAEVASDGERGQNDG